MPETDSECPDLQEREVSINAICVACPRILVLINPITALEGSVIYSQLNLNSRVAQRNSENSRRCVLVSPLK